MAKKTVEVLVDDLEGGDAVASVRIGWNGEWRTLELSEKNLASLDRSLDKYWNASRVVRGVTPRKGKSVKGNRSSAVTRDPKAIRAWAHDNGLAVPARGRIPRDLEELYNQVVAAP